MKWIYVIRFAIPHQPIKGKVYGYVEEGGQTKENGGQFESMNVAKVSKSPIILKLKTIPKFENVDDFGNIWNFTYPWLRIGGPECFKM